LAQQRVVTKERALAWCQSKGNLPYFETSAKDATNLEEAFQCVAKLALQRQLEQLENIPINPNKSVEIAPNSMKSQNSRCFC
jgi:hypothetical protein